MGGMTSRWGTLVCAAAALLFGLLGAGCSQAVPEYNIYVQAFNAQYEQGDAVLDIVGQAERTVVLRRLDRRSDSFDPANAAYYLDNIDPPITASVRSSLKVLKAYNEALAGLANGEAAEILTTRMAALATNISAAGSAAGVALAGPAAAAGADVLVAGTARAIDIALPILKTAATAASREAFRQQLIDAYPAMRDLIVALRKGTPDMFEMIRRSLVTRGSDESRSGRTAEGDRILNKDRQLLAGWVVLMDKTLLALDQAVAAAKSGNSASRIAGLTDASIELKVFAEQMKLIRLKQ